MQENASVPVTHALFTEHSDCTDIVMKTPNVGVSELLSNAAAAGVLKYLLVRDHSTEPRVQLRQVQVTDVLPKRPTTGPLPESRKTREIALSVHCPRNDTQVQGVQAWLQVALNLADLLGRPNLMKPEVSPP